MRKAYILQGSGEAVGLRSWAGNSLRGRQGRPAVQDAGEDALLDVCCILVPSPESPGLAESGSEQTQGDMS